MSPCWPAWPTSSSARSRGRRFPATVAPSVPDASGAGAKLRNQAAAVGYAVAFGAGHPIGRQIPIAPDVTGLSTATPELSPFTMGPAAAMSLPAAAPVPEAGMLQHDPRSATAGFPVSPFSLPMPEFGALFPSFEAGVPALPPLPPLRTEDDARSALTTGSPFYFLENAGGLSGSAWPPQNCIPTRACVDGSAVHPVAQSPFPPPPSRCPCRSLTRHCFRPSTQVCPRSPPCRRYATKTMRELL